jgi:hypothetical protein
MNILSTYKRTQIVAPIVEGNSLRSISRMTGFSLVTIPKLFGGSRLSSHHHDALVRNVHAGRAQCDEIWNFCYAKAKNVREEMKGKGAGDRWGLMLTKLIISYLVGVDVMLNGSTSSCNTWQLVSTTGFN